MTLFTSGTLRPAPPGVAGLCTAVLADMDALTDRLDEMILTKDPLDGLPAHSATPGSGDRQADRTVAAGGHLAPPPSTEGPIVRSTPRPASWAFATALLTLGALTACTPPQTPLVDPLGQSLEQPAPSASASAGATPSAPAPAPASPGPASEPAGTRVLASGLAAPWGLALLPDGDALVSERDTARVLRVPAAGGEPVEVTRLEATRPGGEGGLLGLAVSPDFTSDQLVYAYLTAAGDNRIVRFRLDRPDEVTDVLTGIPKGRTHNGGRLAFGPDGLLYAGTGDTGDTSLSQDPRSLGGKVLRMTPDGEPAEAAGSLVFTRGHRNVQGLAFDDRGRLFATEFGQDEFDEVNELVDGGNYGWPQVEGAGTGGGRFTTPITTWDPSQASPSGAAVVDGQLYVAGLRGQRLWQVALDGSGARAALLEGEYGRLRAVAAAPDGSLWVLTGNTDGRGEPGQDDDRLLRVVLG